MDFDDFGDFGDDFVEPNAGDDSFIDANDLMGDASLGELEANFQGLSDFGGAADFGGVSQDFGDADFPAFTNTSLPPFDSLGSSAGLSAPAAAPMWSPNSDPGQFGGGTMTSPRNNSFTCFLCCCSFCLLFLLMFALLVIGGVLLWKLFDISYDVNHLTIVTQQDAGAAPSTVPPQVIIPY